MAALEMMPREDSEFPAAPTLRVVRPETDSLPRALPVAERRARRAALLRRRRRVALCAGLVASAIILAWPGHAFGHSSAAGLSSDLASSSTLSAGMVYVVQPGDTVDSIARLVNPVQPQLARRDLVAELRSDVVVAGEHVLIP